MAKQYNRYEGYLDRYLGEADAVGASLVLVSRDLHAQPLDKIILIEKGDYLIIFSLNGDQVIWQGDILPRRMPGYDSWIQAGFEPMFWSVLFRPAGGGAGCRATLFKKQKENKQDG